jgi:anti-sigma-K factor RskA
VCLTPKILHRHCSPTPSLSLQLAHQTLALSLSSIAHRLFKMKVISQLTVAALATYATAASVDVNKRDTPLSVKLVASGNSEVKVTVTNNGEKTLNLLSKGTFLDEQMPVEKVSIYSAGGSKFDHSL